MGKKRVVVIGIDGGTFDVILPMVERGELPNIARILREGVSGSLISTIPSVTLPAWASFLTGMNPGKLGIFYVMGNIHATYDEGRPANFGNVPAKRLWNYVTEAGKKVLCVIPFNFSPEPMNGVMVCKGVFNVLKCYPPEVRPKIESILARVRDEGTWGALGRKLDRTPRGSREKYFVDLEESFSISTEEMRSVSMQLLDECDWDLFATVFSSPDKAQHNFWSFMDETHPLHSGEERKIYGDVIQDAYRKVDSAIGDILRKAGDATVILLSDHGISPIHKHFYANRWLNEKGFLRVKGERKRPSYHMVRVPLKRVLEKLGILTSLALEWRVPVVKRMEMPVPEEVDWSRTRAYATPVGVNVNLEGREPCGIVKAEEYEEVRESIRRELLELTDPDTGEKIVARVYRKEDIYSGSYMEDAHDLVYVFGNPRYTVKKNLFPRGIFERISPSELCTAHHSNYDSRGIFLAKGGDFRSGIHCGDVRIIDVLPTALYLQGVPLPRDLDGRILWEALREGLEAERPPIYVEPGDFRYLGEELSPEEEDEVKKQLKQLGYI